MFSGYKLYKLQYQSSLFRRHQNIAYIISANNEFTASLSVTIHGHFGLDKHDALKYQYKSLGFAAWWLLQHTRGYKPFETIINY
jgi:hypothetical protein